MTENATFRGRAKEHFFGNGGTLRNTLAALLQGELRLLVVTRLRKSEYRNDEIKDNHAGFKLDKEGRIGLSKWMEDNLVFAFCECNGPYALETNIIKSHSAALNINKRRSHPWAQILTAKRRITRNPPALLGYVETTLVELETVHRRTRRAKVLV